VLVFCRLAAAIKLNRMQEAQAAAAALSTADGWRQLGTAAMQLLDVELAVAAFKQVRDAMRRCYICLTLCADKQTSSVSMRPLTSMQLQCCLNPLSVWHSHKL
jgi:hypothetical protein